MGSRFSKIIKTSLRQVIYRVVMPLALVLSLGSAASAKCERLDFEAIMLEKTYDGNWELTVAGQTPRINMDVELRPYERNKRPDFWPVEVIGCYPGLIGIPLPGRFNTTIKLDNAIGRKGVAIVGATYFQKKRF